MWRVGKVGLWGGWSMGSSRGCGGKGMYFWGMGGFCYFFVIGLVGFYFFFKNGWWCFVWYGWYGRYDYGWFDGCVWLII